MSLQFASPAGTVYALLRLIAVLLLLLIAAPIVAPARLRRRILAAVQLLMDLLRALAAGAPRFAA